MLRNTHSRTVRSAQKPKGYFLFELALSALMIAVIVVLAFPTYQDYSPEHDLVGEISVLEQARQSQDSVLDENPANLAVEQEENESVPSSDSESLEERSTS